MVDDAWRRGHRRVRDRDGRRGRLAHADEQAGDVLVVIGIVADYQAAGFSPDLDRVDAWQELKRGLDLMKQVRILFGGRDFQSNATMRGVRDLGAMTMCRLTGRRVGVRG